MNFSDELVQAAIIAKAKQVTTVTTLLPDGAGGIKEFQWQGDTFTYPAVRLDLEDNRYEFDEQERCGLQRAEFSFYFYSEERSSKQCSQLKGLMESALIGKGFTINGLKFNRIRLVDNIPAYREDERVWRSQLKLESRIEHG